MLNLSLSLSLKKMFNFLLIKKKLTNELKALVYKIILETFYGKKKLIDFFFSVFIFSIKIILKFH